MSNIYITESNTEGKILMTTSFGELDIELWPKEAPKATRNFIQLCLEGYYNNTIFHRLIKDFILQGGDPTGTGKGGKSIYEINSSEGFIDEFHSRLRFTHRGLLAMANENKPNSNHSQFFFTLDACEFLNKKHTIFGKITGNTIFNLLSVNNFETDKNDKPIEPITIINTKVLWNPFDDIIPSEIKNSDLKGQKKGKKKERKGTKNLKLLSFGDEVCEDDTVTNKKDNKQNKIKSSYDLIEIEVEKDKSRDVPILSCSTIEEETIEEIGKIVQEMTKHSEYTEKNNIEEQNNISEARSLNKEQTKKIKEKSEEYKRLRKEIKQAKKAKTVLLGNDAIGHQKSQCSNEILTPVQQQRHKYLHRKRNNSNRQIKTMEKLQKFQNTLKKAKSFTNHEKVTNDVNNKKKEAYDGKVNSESSDDETDDISWMSSKLKFKKHIDDAYRLSLAFTPTEDNYVTIDPLREKQVS